LAPPAAAAGETISPGWAAFEVITPAKGARTIVSS
jgi:hypothetical protein